MTRRDEQLPLDELAAYTRRTENERTGRVAALEAADPRHVRPQKVPSVWDCVNFMEWETHRDLGLEPLRMDGE